MDAVFPASVLEFSKQFSTFKTPKDRTDGATETNKQIRGEPDWLDTAATLMLWRELVKAGLPATYHLTANTGDVTDIRVQDKGSHFYVDINVKGTKSEVKAYTTPAAYGNVPVKHGEIGVAWPRKPEHQTTAAVTVRRQEDGRVYAFGDEHVVLPDIYIKIFVHETPTHPRDLSRPHVHFCAWIATDSAAFGQEVAAFVDTVNAGQPTEIWGIKHPGLWMPSGVCRPFGQLIEHLEAQLQIHSPGWGGTGRAGWQHLNELAEEAKARGHAELGQALRLGIASYDRAAEVLTIQYDVVTSHKFKHDRIRAFAFVRQAEQRDCLLEIVRDLYPGIDRQIVVIS